MWPQVVCMWPQAPSPKPQAPSPKPQAPSPKPQASSPKPPASGLRPQALAPTWCCHHSSTTTTLPIPTSPLIRWASEWHPSDSPRLSQAHSPEQPKEPQEGSGLIAIFKFRLGMFLVAWVALPRGHHQPAAWPAAVCPQPRPTASSCCACHQAPWWLCLSPACLCKNASSAMQRS